MICNLKGAATTQVLPIPIVSSQCLNQVYIDLIDFRTTPDSKYHWILQIKDHFSQYIHVEPLENKEALTVANAINC
jgi:hypothetical protein